MEQKKGKRIPKSALMVVKKDMEMKKVKESMPSKRIHAANPN